MNFKLLKNIITLVKREYKIIGSNTSDKPFFNFLYQNDRVLIFLEYRKIYPYLFYNQVRNHFYSFTITNKTKQLLNFNPKSVSDGSSMEAVCPY